MDQNPIFIRNIMWIKYKSRHRNFTRP